MRPHRRQPSVHRILQARILEWVAISFSPSLLPDPQISNTVSTLQASLLTSLMEGLVLKGKSVFYWTRTRSNSCLWHQLHSLSKYLKFGTFSSHVHFGFILLNDPTSSRLLLSLCCLFIFIRWPHFLNSQRKQKSFWFSVFLTTVPPPSANFLASLSSFSPSFWYQRKIHLFCTKEAPLLKFCIPETPSTSVHSTLSFLFSLLCESSFPLPALPHQWSSSRNNLPLSPGYLARSGDIFDCHNGGLLSWHPTGVLLATSTPEPWMQLSILQSTLHPSNTPARVPGPQGSQAYRSCSLSFLPPSLPFSFSLSLSLTHTEKHTNKLHFKHIFPLTLQLFVAILIFIFLFS